MSKKNLLVIFLFVLILFNLRTSFSEEWLLGEFVESVTKVEEVITNNSYIDLSEEADFWHYSGGYWQTNYYGNNLRINDEEMQNHIDLNKEVIILDETIVKVPLPIDLKEYLEEGKALENLKFTLESDYITSNVKPENIYKDRDIYISVINNEIFIKYTPIFNIEPLKYIKLKNGELNVSIPMIKSKFGFPLFSIWNKDGSSLGNTNIGNIADIPEGHDFLDGRDSMISIDTSTDIINPQGDLVSKDIGIWNTVPRKYTITEKNTRDHKIGVGTFANGGAAGMKFILPLRMYYPVLEKDTHETKNYMEVFEGNGEIKAMTPNLSKFNIFLGIPSSEEVYTKIIGKSRLTNYEFEKVEGNKDFSVTVKRRYTEKWKVLDRKKSTADKKVYKTKRRIKIVSKNYTINREYSYYRINYLENYAIESAKVTSGILPNGEITLIPKNYIEPIISLVNEVNIVSEPSVESVVTLNPKTVGKNGAPSSPDWSDIADNAVGIYKVQNDTLEFDSEVIMDSSIFEVSTPEPKDIPEATLTNNDVLRKENIKIDDTKRNGNYPSACEILYKKSFDYKGISSEYIVKDVLVNPVKIHTPIYSELLILSIGDDYNQQIGADANDRAIILGMSTKFRYQTAGEHRNILGYGNRDYDKYILKKEIKFPFDIYYNATSRDKSKFVKKNTWVTVDTLDTDIYVPIWVDEGSYIVQIRSKAINSLDLDVSSTGVKNIDENYYIVEDEKIVEVIGRLYGFKVRDINDYPIWEEVFRKANNSYEFIEDNNYPFGGRDENENVLRTNDKFFLPIAPGSHPTFSNAGSIPLGYKIRFTVESIGNYLKNDQILIKPSFSFVDYEGNIKENIKVWSKVRIKNKDYLVDVSSIDSQLKDQITYKIDLGDPFITLTEESFISTSDFLGITLFDLKKRIETIGFADEIALTKYLRSYIGDISNKPDGVDESEIIQSRQKWYGEYWLPNDTYILNEDINLIEYAAENNGIDFSEEVFMKDGYLKVNFNIETSKDSSSVGENLMYKNKQSNMYQIEGFNNDKEIMINNKRQSLYFQDGDVIFYDVNRKRSEDYDSFGTH